MPTATAMHWPGQRDQRDETRARIVDAALQLVAEHGFAATSTREISERLGFTKAALYYHFRTKEELLAAIIEPATADLASLVDLVPIGAPPGERRHVVEGYVDLVAGHADLYRVLSDDPTVRRGTALAEALVLYERLTQVLSGSASPDTAQRARVRAVLGGIHAMLLRGQPGEDRAVLRQTAVAVGCTVLGLPLPRRPRDGTR